VELALVVIAPLSPDQREFEHAKVVRKALAGRFIIEQIDLVNERMASAMSRTERLLYESPEPLVDQYVVAHAAMVSRANVMVFIFPTNWWTPPPVLKAWIERTFVPNVAFVLDSKNRVRPNLRELRAVVGVTTHTRPEAIASGGDGARRMLLRTMRLNAPRKVSTDWLVDPDESTLSARIVRL
jgi:NAD(P)H dehydrogenase (quinone)